MAVQQEWPNIKQWLEYCTSQCVKDPKTSSLNVPARAMVFRTVLGFFKACFESRIKGHPLTKTIAPTAAKLGSQLWILLYEDPTVSESDLYSLPLRVMHSAFAELEDQVTVGEQVKKWTGKKARVIAGACVAQIQLSNSDSMGLLEFLRGVMVFTFLSTDDSISRALIHANSTRAVIQVMKCFSRKASSPNANHFIPGIIMCACQYLKQQLSHVDGIPQVICVLESGILPVLLRAERWLLHLQSRQREDFLTFLRDVLPIYLVYISVLRVAAKELKRIERLGLEDGINKKGPLWDAWTLFKNTAQERIEVAGKLVHRTCNNTKVRRPLCYPSLFLERDFLCQCNRLDSRGKFPRCSGCLEGYYCSRECQRSMWSEHRRRCKEIQIFRRGELISDTY